MGGAVGGVVAIALLATGTIFFRRRSRRPRPEEIPLNQEPPPPGIGFSSVRKPTPPPAPVEMFVQPHELDGGGNMAELPAHTRPAVTRVPVRSRV